MHTTDGCDAAAAAPMVPGDDDLEAFKEDVRTWLRIDESIRNLQAALRERNAAKRALTTSVGAFMSRYNVEDLRTLDGARLRYRTSLVRAPLSHVDIRDRIARHIADSRYAGDSARADDEVRALHDALFGGGREKIERPSLRRLPGPPVRTT